jgi:hypothetical protein
MVTHPTKVTVYRYQYTDKVRAEPVTASRMGTKEYVEMAGGWIVEGSGTEVDASNVDDIGKTEIGFTG